MVSVKLKKVEGVEAKESVPWVGIQEPGSHSYSYSLHSFHIPSIFPFFTFRKNTHRYLKSDNLVVVCILVINNQREMGVLSNKIDREQLKPGDHIYSWRQAYIYAHHGHLFSPLLVPYIKIQVCLS